MLKFISFFGMCGLALLPCPKLKAQQVGLTQYTYILTAGGNAQKLPGTASSTGVWGTTYASDDFSGYATIDPGNPLNSIIHAKGTLHASANPGYGDYRNGGQSQFSVTFVYSGNYPGETYILKYFLATGGPPVEPANCGGQLISSLANNGHPIYQGGGQITGTLVPDIPYSIEVNVQGNTCANGPNGSGGNLICDDGYQSSYDGSWEFTLLILGQAKSTVLPQPNVSQVQHQFTAADLWRQSALMAGAALLEQSGGSPQALLCGALFADASAVANADQQLVQGSADTNFTVIALPVMPSLTPLSSGANFTQADADAFNIWATNLVEQSVFAQAIGACFNRAIGASAASNSYWEQQQVNAIYEYEAQFAWYLDAEPALRSNFVAVLEADAFPSTTIDPTNVIAFEQSIASNGLPSVLASVQPDRAGSEYCGHHEHPKLFCRSGSVWRRRNVSPKSYEHES